MKKVLAIVLALCMVFAMGTVAFALPTEDNIAQAVPNDENGGLDKQANTVSIVVPYDEENPEMQDMYTITISADITDVAWNTTAVNLPVSVTGQWAAGKTLTIGAEADATMTGKVSNNKTLTMSITDGAEKTIDANTILNGVQTYNTVVAISGYDAVPYDTYTGSVLYTAELA